jgi:P27 family predicted phage terminase small subunit
MPGPAPTPTRLKVLRGNPGKRKINGAEPVPLRGLPECPERFKGAAREAWLFLSEQAKAMGMDFRIDSLSLAGACQAYGRAIDADAVIDSLGPTFTTPNGYVQQRPEVSIALQNWKMFKAFATEWGFTPASRSRLSIELPSDKFNKFAQLRQEAEDLSWNRL